EQIAGYRDATDPYQRSQKIENGKHPPAHSQHSGQRPGDHAQPENEAREENCRSAVTGEESFAPFKEFLTNSKETLVAFEEWPSSIVASGKSQIVAQRGRTDCHRD